MRTPRPRRARPKYAAPRATACSGSPPAGTRREPAVEHLEQALAQRRSAHDTAVEQHRGRVRAGGRLALAGEEMSQVAGDGGVARVGQAELLQAGAALPVRPVADRAARKEAIDKRAFDVIARR